MPWEVAFHPEFEPEFRALPRETRIELAARLEKLADFGPDLGRPDVDTLKGSSFPNMKELRFQVDGVWRFAFVFDPTRRAIVLVGGDKQGDKRFYDWLIRIADKRFAAHVAEIKQNR